MNNIEGFLESRVSDPDLRNRLNGVYDTVAKRLNDETNDRRMRSLNPNSAIAVIGEGVFGTLLGSLPGAVVGTLSSNISNPVMSTIGMGAGIIISGTGDFVGFELGAIYRPIEKIKLAAVNALITHRTETKFQSDVSDFLRSEGI